MAQLKRVAGAVLHSDDFSCDGLSVRSVKGREAISELYRFDIELATSEGVALLDPDAMVGAGATLAFVDDARNVLRRVHGVVSRATRRDSRASYELELSPYAWRMSLVRTQEIFMGKSLPQILQEKLERVALESYLKKRLAGSFPELEFVVQYRESDLAFASRLTEHVGLCFFFEQDDDGESMVLCDDTTLLSPGARVPCHGRLDDVGIHEVITTSQGVPRTFAVSDYNYRTPQVDMAATHTLESGLAGGVLEYATHHKTQEEGAALARVRAEEAESRRRSHELRGTVVELHAGALFELEGYADLEGKPLLVTAVSHRLEGSRYESVVTAISGATPFRPARVTPRPRIHGVVNAIVQGAGAGTGRAAEVDDQGRYWVQFQFDSSFAGEAKASRPVRMAQPFMGDSAEGMHFPLRPGTEVLLAFIDGDPDRPIIVGALPNIGTPSPVVGANSKVNRIQTYNGISIQFGKRS